MKFRCAHSYFPKYLAGALYLEIYLVQSCFFFFLFLALLRCGFTNLQLKLKFIHSCIHSCAAHSHWRRIFYPILFYTKVSGKQRKSTARPSEATHMSVRIRIMPRHFSLSPSLTFASAAKLSYRAACIFSRAYAQPRQTQLSCIKAIAYIQMCVGLLRMRAYSILFPRL